jgi:iron complex outermembrane receptor protein
MMSRSDRRLRLLFATCIVSAAALPAYAETAAAAGHDSSGPATLEEVIVTARKTEESMQSTPVAVTAFTQKILEQQNIERPVDLQYHTPGLQVNLTFQNPGGYTIRGQGVGQGRPASVLSYFAGVPRVPQGLFDLQSVQVLKGPQGTLFGRTSTGGAVLVEPQRPTDRYEGFAEAEALSRDGLRVTAAVSIPVSDVFSLRIAAQHTKQMGYTVSFNTGEDFNNLNLDVFRVGALFKPASWFENYTLLEHFNSQERYGQTLIDGNLPIYDPVTHAAQIRSACVSAATLSGVPNNTDFIGGCVTQRSAVYSAIQNDIIGARARYAAGDVYRVGTAKVMEVWSRGWNATNQTRFTLPDMGPLTAISIKNIFGMPFGTKSFSSYATNDSSQFPIQDFSTGYTAITPGTCVTSGPNIGQCTEGFATAHPRNGPTTAYTDEVNLDFKVASRLSVLAGLFYSRTEDTQFNPNLATYLQGLVLTPLRTPTQTQGVTYYSRDRELGAFVQATLDLDTWVHGLHLTGGYRWNDNESERINGTSFTSAKSQTDLKNTGFNYTLSAEYQATDRLFLYAVRSRAYKPGGINNATCGISVPPCPVTYGPETTVSTELGAKWDWSVGALMGRTNVAAYHLDIANLIRTYVSPTATVYNANSAQATNDGLEVEQNLLFNGFEASAYLSLMHPKYTKWFAQVLPQFPCIDPIGNSHHDCADYTSNRFTGSPEVMVGATIRYTLPLSPDVGQVVPSVSIAYQSSENYADVEVTSPNTDQGPFTLINARIEWNRIMKSNWSAVLWGRNLTDKIYKTGAQTVYTSLGTVSATFAEPRTIGASLKYSF